jgi:uncharacterized protein with HEPN domain
MRRKLNFSSTFEPWRKVAGFRDVDLEEVWRIIRDDLPALVKLLEPLVPPEENNT